MIVLPSDIKIYWSGDRTGKEQWKVRQPLWGCVIGEEVDGPYEEIIKDELNVKHLVVCKDIGDGKALMPNSTTGWCGEWIAFIGPNGQVDLHEFLETDK